MFFLQSFFFCVFTYGDKKNELYHCPNILIRSVILIKLVRLLNIVSLNIVKHFVYCISVYLYMYMYRINSLVWYWEHVGENSFTMNSTIYCCGKTFFVCDYCVCKVCYSQNMNPGTLEVELTSQGIIVFKIFNLSVNWINS
jgi:hypothetical protein